MIPAIMFKKNIVLTAYLRDRLIKGCLLSAEWGVITVKDAEIMSYDGKYYRNGDIEQFDVADAIAVGTTGTRGNIVKNNLCWELCELEREISD